MILDTCTLIFLAMGDGRLSRAARTQLSRAPVRWYCAISAFEVALKHRQGKLELPIEPLPWLRALAERYALSELALDAALCARAAGLPNHHRDPFDRLLAAQALDGALVLVSSDPAFRLISGVELLS